MTRCLVFDLGAGSGRAIVAEYVDDRLSLHEVYRFAGYAVERPDGLHWDIERLLGEVEAGLREAKQDSGTIDSIGVDSWGMDYALLDADGRMLCEPFHYRHPRSLRGWQACPLAFDALFARTGSQHLQVNTIYQLYDESREHPERLAEASHMLLIADLVCHHLTGVIKSEVTLARTTGMLEAASDQLDPEIWDPEICRDLGLPHSLLPPLIRAGSTFGSLKANLAEPLGWKTVPVIAVAAHDTASAVAALGLDDGSGFLICGSWLLFGVENSRIDRRPVVMHAGFGNEGGIGQRSFLVKSLNGLHLIQKLKESWGRRTGENLDFAELSQCASTAAQDGPVIDLADFGFFNPPDVVDSIIAAYENVGARAPRDIGSFAVAIYRSLAAEVGRASHGLETLIGRKLPGLRVCGGGAQDELLCSLIQKELDRPLRIGPIEASAWGNAILQLLGLGAIKSLEDGRRLVERSADFCDLVRKSVG
jgi:rhamnulokinase